MSHPVNVSEGAIMSRRSTVIALLAATTFAGSAIGQTTPVPQAAGRKVVATAKLASVADAPIYFRALRVTIPPGEKSSITADDGILYQVSGSTLVSSGQEVTTITAGDGLFIASRRSASVQAGASEPSTYLHFVLVRAADLDRPVATAPALVTELYRTVAPIPELKTGTHDLNLTRVTFPAHSPSNAPHHRTGAALYTVLAGAGAMTVEGKTEAKESGAFIYEPSTLVHQWGNPGDEPFTFLVFNINPEGTAAVVPAQPTKVQ
jgi:quercetin dioxygenase-like cupin family protein